MSLSLNAANRLGFTLLGLTNNFAYVIMLSAAYDLLKPTSSSEGKIGGTDSAINASNVQLPKGQTTELEFTLNNAGESSTPPTVLLAPNQTAPNQAYCHPHSTSTILLADTLPSLTIKILYPFLLVQVPAFYKATATALLSAAAFIVTGLSTSQLLIFTGVVCASFSSGLGESFFLSNSPLYGDVALSGWSIGTGGAGLFGALVHAVLRRFLPIKIIMLVMLIVPVVMMLAFFVIIRPISKEVVEPSTGERRSSKAQPVVAAAPNTLCVISPASRGDQLDPDILPISQQGINYGTDGMILDSRNSLNGHLINAGGGQQAEEANFDFWEKIRILPSLAKYFLPLLLVYFAEYFINQGLFELIYYPGITFLSHGDQYSWFQVSYQLGVMISRSSLDLIRIKQIWTMSLLQALNASIFLAHAARLIHIPSFYLVIILIIYEGLLGGFTYVNAFYRIKKEVRPDRQEFCISTVTLADTLGIVMAGLAALPVHESLCKLYDPPVAS